MFIGAAPIMRREGTTPWTFKTFDPTICKRESLSAMDQVLPPSIDTSKNACMCRKSRLAELSVEAFLDMQSIRGDRSDLETMAASIGKSGNPFNRHCK
jgi:hypothetical protein